MKKINFFIALIVMSVCSILSVNAQELSGVYKGTLTDIKMNNKSYDDADNVTFIFTDYGNGKGNLTGIIGPIGKMPGTIHVNMEVTITDGNVLTASKDTYAGKLVLNSGSSMDISVSSFSGYVTGNTIHFVLNTYAFKAFGAEVFPASVTFDGDK